MPILGCNGHGLGQPELMVSRCVRCVACKKVSIDQESIWVEPAWYITSIKLGLKFWVKLQAAMGTCPYRGRCWDVSLVEDIFCQMVYRKALFFTAGVRRYIVSAGACVSRVSVF